MLPRRRDSLLVPSISVPGDANAGVIGKHPLEANPHLGSPVGDDDLAGVKG